MRVPLAARTQKLISLDDMPQATGHVTDCYTLHWGTYPHAQQHRRGCHA
jgi:hypothetical protein